MRESLRVLHAADLHLDSPFEALPGEKAAQRRGEQRQLLDAIAALAAERGAQLVLLSGDLLDSGSAYRETAESLCRALQSIPCPVFIAPGNHDYYSARSPWARLELPENVHLFTEPTLTCVPLPELGAEVWGAAFVQESSGPLLADFTPPERSGARLRLMCLHGQVGPGEGRYNPITEEEIARSGMDYLALGHSHACSGLRRAGESFYAWPGCAEGRGFDETGEKGVLLLDIAPGRCEAEFIPVARRRYHRLTVDVSQTPDALTALRAALPAGGERDIFKITLTGETHAPPDLSALRAGLEGAVFALRLRDETRPARDIWAAREADTLRGLFLRRLWEKLQAAETEAERETIVSAVRFGLAAMDKAEEPLA